MPIAPPALLTSTATSSSDAASAATDAGSVTSRVTARTFGHGRGQLVEPVAPPRGGHHVEALRGQAPRGRRPDPARRSRDHCNSAHPLIVPLGHYRGMGAIGRVAMLSVHTSPLDPPGGGDAGGMNVYIVETAKRLAARGIGVEIFTRATRSDQPPSVELAPGRAGAPRRRRPVRGAGQGRPARPAVRVHRRRAAHRGLPRAGLVRPRALALLALRPGRLAGPGPVERAARPLGAHPGQGQERAAGRGRHPRAARPGHRRGAGGRRGRPADHLHRRRGARAGRALRRRPREGAHGRAGCRPGRVHPGRPRRGPRRARVRRRRPAAAVRRPHPTAQGPGRAAACRGAPRGAGAGGDRRRRQRLRPRAPRVAHRPRARPRPRVAPSGSCRRSPPASSRGTTGRRP